MKTLSDFVKDKRVQELEKRETLFEILSLREEGCSKMLAWFLDPKEGHNLGNAFALYLLDSCADDKNKVYAITPDDKKNNRYIDVSDKTLFQNSVVYTEYNVVDCKAGRNGKKKGRADILSIDFEHNICLVVENKYGSSEHDNQCHTYCKALKQLSKKNPKMKFIFVYLDFEEREEDDEYYSLTYNEIFTFKIKEKESFAYRLFEDWKIDVNGFEEDQEEREKIIKELSDDYAEMLEANKKLYCKKNKKDILDSYLKTTDKDILLYAEYEHTINEILFYYKNKDIIELYHTTKFKKIFESKTDIICEHLITTKKHYIVFTHKNMVDKDGIWKKNGYIEKGATCGSYRIGIACNKKYTNIKTCKNIEAVIDYIGEILKKMEK